MTSPNYDLEDFMEKFCTLSRNKNLKRKTNQEIFMLIENIATEIEICRENEKCLSEKLKQISESNNGDSNITTKYTENKEKYDILEVEFTELKKKFNETEENLKKEIENLKNKIESDRICFDLREKELLNQIEVANARTSLECDEIETTLTGQLIDITRKLRESQNNVTILQLENMNLKNQLRCHNQTSSTPTPRKDKTLVFEQPSIKTVKTLLNMNKSRNSDSANINENMDYSDGSNVSTVQVAENKNQVSIEISKNSQNSPQKQNLETHNFYAGSSEYAIINDEIDCNYRDPSTVQLNIRKCGNNNYSVPLYQGSGRKSYINKVPPLKQCSDSSKKRKANKRKLYDPDDFVLYD